MQYLINQSVLNTNKSDCLVVALFEKGRMSPSAEAVDTQIGGIIRRMLNQGDIDGKVGSTLILHEIDGLASKRLLLVGCGKQDETTERQFDTLISATIKALNTSGADDAISALAEINVNNRSLAWKIRQIVATTDNTFYRYTQTKSSKDSAPAITSLSLLVDSAANKTELDIAAKQGQAIANGMSLARNLGDLPGNICTPTYLANKAVELGKKHEKINTTILDEADMAELGMHSLLSVSRGSREPAKFIIMNYQGAGNNDKPVVFVGKGLTFDAGGISLKPAPGMDEMKYDMCGSASVFGTLSACAELDLPINVIGVVPSSENLPDGDANKPGDVVTSMAGKTIEILNTDAEGRLILCDALTYSERFEPAAIIDIATLTGAIIVALGHQTTGLMANNQAIADEILAASTDSNDKAWQLPIWDEYQPQLDSNFADMGNIGGKGAGSITAACFLSRFTENMNWAHLDIAGTAWKSGGKDKGATGRPVPLLVQFLLNRI
jgi:leucyl aminopeptidase